MSIIENGQILLQYIVMKGPGTSFWSPALSQKIVRNVCHKAHQYLTKFHFYSIQNSKEISIRVTSIMQQCLCGEVLKCVDLKKTQKYKYFEKKALFFLQINKFLNYISRATLWQKNIFAAEVTFKLVPIVKLIFHSHDTQNLQDV